MSKNLTDLDKIAEQILREVLDDKVTQESKVLWEKKGHFIMAWLRTKLEIGGWR